MRLYLIAFTFFSALFCNICLIQIQSAQATSEALLYNELLYVKEQKIQELEARIRELEALIEGTSYSQKREPHATRQSYSPQSAASSAPLEDAYYRSYAPSHAPRHQTASLEPVRVRSSRDSEEEEPSPFAPNPYEFEVSAEVSYLKPRLSSASYAQQPGKVKELDFDYDLAYKLAGNIYFDEDWRAGASVFYYTGDEKERLSGTLHASKQLFANDDSTIFNEAIAQAELDYWAVDCYAGKHFDFRRYTLDLDAGVEALFWSYDQREQFFGPRGSLNLRHDQNFKGAGPMIKAKQKYFFNRYSFAELDTNFSLPYGVHETNIATQTESYGLNPTTLKKYMAVPHMSAELGVGFYYPKKSIGGYAFKISYGYETLFGIDRQTQVSSTNLINGQREHSMSLDGIKFEFKNQW